ncbi:MAG: hypothetical protein ACI4XJ_11130 [Eubacteriales bacterium]
MNNRFAIFVLSIMCALLFCTCSKSAESTTDEQIYYRSKLKTEFGGLRSQSCSIVKDGEDYLCVYAYFNPENGDKSLNVRRLDSDGQVISEKEILSENASLYLISDNIICTYYAQVDGKIQRTLAEITTEGEILHSAPIKQLLPDGVTNGSIRRMCKTDDGYALQFEKYCILLDSEFNKTSEFKYSSADVYSMSYEDGVLCFAYSEPNENIFERVSLSGEVLYSVVLPDRFKTYYNQNPIIRQEDGFIWSWDDYGVFKWKLPEPAESEERAEVISITNFLDAYIAGDRVNDLKYFGDEMAVYQMDMTGNERTYEVFVPDDTIDFSNMEVLELYCVQPDMNLNTAVAEFNKSHSDVRICVTDYNIYNTYEYPVAGYERLYLDIAAKIIEPDILYIPNFYRVFNSHPDYFIDLYTLMDGEVTKDSIYGCVRSCYESENGELYCITPTFNLSSLVGKRSVIGDDMMSLSSLLDMNDSLGEGEYLIEEVGRDNYSYALFSNATYTGFIGGNTANFTSPLFKRYLTFIKSLPDKAQTYMDHGSNNVSDLYAGVISEDQVYVQAAGENLYYSGKIKLMKSTLRSVYHLFKDANEFGEDEITGLNYAGNPIELDKNVSTITLNSYNGYYTVPKCSKNPDLAWDFIELRLLLDAKELDSDERREYMNFFTLKNHFDDYLDSLEGYRIIFFESGSRVGGYEIELDSDGCYNGQPGRMFVIDRDEIDYIKNLLDSDLMPNYMNPLMCDIESTGGGIYAIIYEEESSFLGGASTVDGCAEAINSRVNIYLSERE